MKSDGVFNLDEWNCLVGKMVRHHWMVSNEVKETILLIRKEMKQELVPIAEEKANYGKNVKSDIRRLWSLHNEIVDIQTKFIQSLGAIDLEHLTDDFVEDIMQQSKPLQIILQGIRNKQFALMNEIKEKYWTSICELEPLIVAVPPSEKEKQEVTENSPVAVAATQPTIKA